MNHGDRGAAGSGHRGPTREPAARCQGYFITGTDTDCGKTLVTLGLMHLLRGRGYRVQGMKPVAAGAEPGPEGLRNGDALLIRAQASEPVAYSLVNPWLFEPAVAPHLAAERAGEVIDFRPLASAFQALRQRADRVVVEGAGGWLVPLGGGRTMADLARRLDLPVILVVGLKLGCLNHALLTRDAIQATGLPLAGWVGNLLDPAMSEQEGNLATLREQLPAPCLGVIPRLWHPGGGAAAQRLRLPPSC